MNGNLVDTWTLGLGQSFEGIGSGVVQLVPKIVVAIIIFVIGWIVAVFLGKAIAQIIKAIKVDNILKSAGVEDVLQRAGFHLDSGVFLGALVKWFIIVVFLVASLDVLQLTQVNVFLSNVVLSYLPQVIVAVLILLVAAVLADATQKIVVGTAKAAGSSSAHLFGGIARWAIWVFAIIVALDKLGILADYGTILFQGIVYMFVIGGGLAFGLGGKEAAARFIEKLRTDISK